MEKKKKKNYSMMIKMTILAVAIAGTALFFLNSGYFSNTRQVSYPTYVPTTATSTSSPTAIGSGFVISRSQNSVQCFPILIDKVKDASKSQGLITVTFENTNPTQNITDVKITAFTSGQELVQNHSNMGAREIGNVAFNISTTPTLIRADAKCAGNSVLSTCEPSFACWQVVQ